MGRLEGKIALISGGARGQGAAEAKVFAAEGASVVFGDILDDEGRGGEAAIAGTGGTASYVRLDVTREADWEAAVAAAVSHYGGTHRRGVGSDSGGEHAWSVPWNETRHPGDAGRRWRVDHQYLFGRGIWTIDSSGASLCSVQGRGPDPEQGGGNPTRQG